MALFSESDLTEILKNPHLRVVGQERPESVRPDTPEVPVAIGGLRPRKMNKLEARYAEYLEAQKGLGEVLWYDYEAITLRLGDDCRYIPDFLVLVRSGHLEVRETKGFWEDDAKVKIRVAAELYPVFRFVAIQEVPKKDGGGWKETDFSRPMAELEDAPAMLSATVKTGPAKKPRKPRAPADPRSVHPAIQAIREVMVRNPPKALYDRLIEAVGDIPNIPLMSEMWREWREVRRYSPENFAWITEWYRKGGVCDIRGNRIDGNGLQLDKLSKTDDRLLDPSDKSWEAEQTFAVVVDAQEALPEHVYRDRAGYENWRAGWLKDRPQDLHLVEEYERSEKFRQRFPQKG